MDPGERIAALLAVKAFEPDRFIVMGSQKGVVKKTDLTAFSNPRAGGIIAMGVEEDDRVMDVRLTDGQGQIFLGTRNGMAIRFPESDVRAMGRTAYGVRGISLRDDDEVVAMEVVRPAAGGEVPALGPDVPEDGAGEGPVAPADAAGGTLLSVTENGYGKRTGMEEYRVQSRGGLGIINIQTSERNGRVIGIALVYDDDELLLISQQGKILRTAARDVRTIGRATQGVRLIDIDPDDRVVSVARLAEKEEEDKTGFEA